MTELRISDLLMKIGIPTNISGYKYLKEAIQISYNSKGKVRLVKDVYCKVGPNGGESASAVEKCIRYAKKISLENLSEDYLYLIFKTKDRKLSNARFISSLAEYIKKEEMVRE